FTTLHLPIVYRRAAVCRLLTIFVFSLFSNLVHAQEPRKDSGADGRLEIRQLKGEVRSATDNRPIEGVSIRVGKEQAGTDRQGRFSIALTQPEGSLEARHIGYKAAAVAFGPATAYLTIALEPLENQIEEVEVVSTGYQKIPKERATGSFEFVDSALFNRKVSTDFVSRLEDVVPSISFNKLFENNRGRLPNITVRGMSTIRSQRWPLIVLDG